MARSGYESRTNGPEPVGLAVVTQATESHQTYPRVTGRGSARCGGQPRAVQTLPWPRQGASYEGESGQATHTFGTRGRSRVSIPQHLTGNAPARTRRASRLPWTPCREARPLVPLPQLPATERQHPLTAAGHVNYT